MSLASNGPIQIESSFEPFFSEKTAMGILVFSSMAIPFNLTSTKLDAFTVTMYHAGGKIRVNRMQELEKNASY